MDEYYTRNQIQKIRQKGGYIKERLSERETEEPKYSAVDEAGPDIGGTYY